MSATVLEGDVFDLLPRLKPGSVDCVMTSPPYYRLRSYLPKEHPLKPRELGSEPTVGEYVANMVRVFQMVRNCLADHGTVWCNIGDSYAGGASGQNGDLPDVLGRPKGNNRSAGQERAAYIKRDPVPGLEAGNLLLVPQRLAIALQDDGWVVRSVVCWCLSPSTVVYAKTATTEGPMTIHDLVRLDPSTVKLWTGERWSQVRGWSQTETDGDTFRFTLRSGEAITCTGNHRWPLADGRVVRADEIREGDALAACRTPEPEATEGDGLEDLAWFAGLYLAEGHIDGDCIHISGDTREVERHARVGAIVRMYGGSATLHCEGDAALQRVHGRVLLGAIEHFIAGKGAKGKHFSPRVWRSSNAVLRALLLGYLDGDGHWDGKNRRWRLGFCRNNALAQDLRTVAARLGLQLTLNATYAKMGRTRTFEAYRGEIRLEPALEAYAKNRTEVVKIERGWGGTFYDVGIADEPHLFALASGVLTHNSKPAPMPASVQGWSWRRCRVKVKGQAINPESKKYEVAAAMGGCVNQGSFKQRYEKGEGVAEWADCPGCKRCTPHGGYVLRRGSWRPTSAWEPVLMLAKGPGYYADGEACKVPALNTGGNGAWGPRGDAARDPGERDDLPTLVQSYALANLRDVWTVAAEPLREKHYAAFPTELVRRCLAAGLSARGYCPACGAPWARVLESTPLRRDRPNDYVKRTGEPGTGNVCGNTVAGVESVTLGWRPSCSCPEAPPRPGLVLDCFCGSGRTGVVAGRLGHDFVGLELNSEYAVMARRILRDEMPLFAGEAEP